LRQIILSMALAACCGWMQLAAQPGFPFPHQLLPGPTRGRNLPRPPSAVTTAGQSAIFDATGVGSPLVLDKDWRVGITANSAASTPEFDDSGWAIRNGQGMMADVPDEDQPDSGTGNNRGSPGPAGGPRRFAWFRLHIKLAPGHGPLSLLIEVPVSENTSLGIGSGGPGADVFANGKQINPEGPHGDAPQHYQQISRLYDLNLPASQTSLVLVVRTIYVPFGYGSYTGFFIGHSLSLGNRDDLDRALKIWMAQSIFERLPRLVGSILLLVLALFLLALYFGQKGHPEYLWLALHELLQAPIGFVELGGSTARLDSLWYAAVAVQLLLISAYVYFEFLIAFLAIRPKKKYIQWQIRLLRYTAPILAGVGPTLLFVGHNRAIGTVLAIFLVFSIIWILCWGLFIFATLIAATLRRNFEAGLLLIPLVLSGVGIIEPVLTSAISDWNGRPFSSPLTIQAGPIPIRFASIADYTGMLVIVLIIFVRFLRIHRDQERATNELAAARTVQELMIPHEKLATPGYEVNSVYSPANEVGGDFFHVQPASDGGLLVVIGDVAGKGLKAAMNVSMLMGALRRTQERSPAKILESLNRVLTGSDSLATCQAVWFGADGGIILANAGHLPPYLNSQEIELPGALPLGVLPEIHCDELRFYLHPGDRMLLLSDGVVEARRPSGELFGFDRVHNLSNQSAFYISEAAKNFGQQDDITVLTIRRLVQTKAA